MIDKVETSLYEWLALLHKLSRQEQFHIKADPNLTELNEIINWSKEQTKIENITGKAEMGYLNEDKDLTESLECPICGIEVNEGSVFCPNCKSKFSKPQE